MRSALPCGAGATATVLQSTINLPNQKAIIHTTASLSVSKLTLTGAFIPNASGGNGAGIRDQMPSGTLSVDDVTFRGNQEGILTGGSGGKEIVRISNSRFEGNGNASKNTGQEHGVYVNDAASLTISSSVFCGQVGQGHNIKSRAAATTITGVRSYEGVAGGGCTASGNASRGIDIPNGGVLSMTDVDLFQGPATGNSAMFEYGAEGLRFSVNRASLTGVDLSPEMIELATALAACHCAIGSSPWRAATVK